MEIKLTINEKKVIAHKGQTILEAAKNIGIIIPTLCHDERVEIYGACGICMVEEEGSAKLLRACSTAVIEGMVVTTDSGRVLKNRRTVLELLLSDHKGDCKAPCVLACPARTDCQGYVNLIAQGRNKDALKLIMDKIPLPASIGRVCSHPCEDACRRQLVEEPIAIAQLKQFAADVNKDNAVAVPEPGPLAGTAVAIIGGGPGGLSAAYFLRLSGHAVTIFDAMPEMGGMLLYGIPEYRLPHEVLQKEINVITNMGVTLHNGVRIGAENAYTLGRLRGEFDAVIVAAGAWQNMKLGCPGEDLQGVMGGIDMLREVALGSMQTGDFAGKKVAVIGGGNTAMDACRTAVRLGADKVYNIYRRTKNEMPAQPAEISEAEEEGVIFKTLMNPIEIMGSDGNVKDVRLQITELGEPDESGRRTPVAIEGKEEVLSVDIVISAIGQKLNPSGFEELEFTKKGTIKADPGTYSTNLNGVFAIGDAVNEGADIAITVIGQAKKAAEAVNIYLSGEERVSSPIKYFSKEEKTAEDFKDEKKCARVQIPYRSAKERRKDFSQLHLGLNEDDALKEAARCLACGCKDYYECKLIKYANELGVEPEKFGQRISERGIGEIIPNITQTPEKCILCGLCVRLCEEDVGEGVLGFMNRGFDTVVRAAGDTSICLMCGKCAEICPTGALRKS